MLEGLVQRELLLSDGAFVERLRSAPARSLAPMRGVFIRACDRPEQLANLLKSLADYERRHRAGRRYVVVDDSVLQANINEQRDQLREFARTTGCKVNYVGAAERAKLVERLNKALPDHKDAIAPLLLRDAHPHAQRFGGGRGWNLSMLLSAGARMALIDDDERLPLRQFDAVRGGLDPNPNGVLQARFFASMEQALGAGSEVEQDAFALHLDVCGRTLGTLIGDAYPIDREALRGLNLSRLDLLTPQARILSTQHGSYGSSRTATGLWLYQLDGESRADFWRDRESYLRNAEAQYMLSGVAQARAWEVAGFTPFTMDNSTFLPCTNPVGRAEDSLGNALARYCMPDALAFELPVAVGHVQESARRRSTQTLAASQPRSNDYLRDFVRQQSGLFRAEDPGQRLQLLGEVMRDLAHASERERIEQLREYLSYVRADVIDRLQHQLEGASEAPVYWQADARAIVEANAKVLLNAAAPPRLSDWPEDLDAAGCARQLTRELDLFADACEHWPALWRYAAEQGEKLLTAL